MNKNDTLAAYSDFKKWCKDNPHLDLDPRPHTHGGAIGDGGYISDEKTRIAFAAWRAAIKADRQQHQLTLDGVYTQRNALAIAFAKAAIAAGWVAGRGFDSGAPKGWSDDWRHVVYVDLPDGRQASWHMSPECVPLLDGLPEYIGAWDGTSIARDAEWCRFSYDRQQRGEPVAFSYELATTRSVDGKYVDWSPRLSYSMPDVPNGSIRSLQWLYAAPQPATPAQEPSDELKGLADRAYCQYIEQMSRPECKGVEYKLLKGTFGISELKAHNKAHEYLGRHRAFSEAYALLARYGQPVEPEGWQLVPKIPTVEVIAAMREAIVYDQETTGSVYAVMLEYAPKFGEEE